MSGKARIPDAARSDGSDVPSRATTRSATAIAAGALPELVDPIGILWLQRPDGWESQIDNSLPRRPMLLPRPTCARSLRREEKRRRAAEQVAVRLRADIAERETSLEALRARSSTDVRADVVKAEDEVAELRAEARRSAHRSASRTRS